MMTKRNRIILILALIGIALVAGMVYSYILSRKAAPSEPVTARDFFTFGTSTKSSQSSQIEPTSTQNNTAEEVEQFGTGLRQISARPIAGAYALSVTRTKAPETRSTPNNIPPIAEWSRDLKEGDIGDDVRELQQFLNLDIGATGTNQKSTKIAITGPGSPGQESSYFGKATKSAVIAFQERFATDILIPSGLVSGSGVADEKTRIKIHELKTTLPQKESATAVRYVDRATGNIYQTFLDTLSEKRISDTTLPKIYEAYFGNNGKNVLLRLLEDDNATIATYAGQLPDITETGDSALATKGGFLERNIKNITLSPDNTKFFYLLPTEQNTVGIIADLSGSSRSQVFSSAFTEWLPEWVSDRIIALTTKPSALVPGYLYTIDIKTKETKKVLGDIRGLTTLYSPNGKKVLYSETTGNGSSFTLSLYDTNTKQSAAIGIDTLPEKCVWASDNKTIYCAIPTTITPGQYPDIWYQGIVSFSDAIWKIDTVLGLSKIITTPEQDNGIAFDGINLFLDVNEVSLFMTNKKDATLWQLPL